MYMDVYMDMYMWINVNLYMTMYMILYMYMYIYLYWSLVLHCFIDQVVSQLTQHDMRLQNLEQRKIWQY